MTRYKRSQWQDDENIWTWYKIQNLSLLWRDEIWQRLHQSRQWTPMPCTDPWIGQRHYSGCGWRPKWRWENNQVQMKDDRVRCPDERLLPSAKYWRLLDERLLASILLLKMVTWKMIGWDAQMKDYWLQLSTEDGQMKDYWFRWKSIG